MKCSFIKENKIPLHKHQEQIPQNSIKTGVIRRENKQVCHQGAVLRMLPGMLSTTYVLMVIKLCS